MRANYGPTLFDITHLVNGSVLYELPVGHGRRFLNRNKLLDGFFGGWQLSSTFQLHGGIPFTPVMGTVDLSGSLAGSWRSGAAKALERQSAAFVAAPAAA